MHSRLRTFLISFLMAAMLFSSAVLANTVIIVAEAHIASGTVLINGQNVDQQNSLYPLLNFKDITYFPLTWNYGQALGFQVVLDAETGLTISRGTPVPGLDQDLLPEGSAPQLSSSVVAVTLPTFPIALMGEVADPQSEWPYLIYNDITYIPFTWENAVDYLHLSYTFDPETNTLSINALKDEPPVTKPPLVEPVPPIITGQLPTVVYPEIVSLLENGHPITVAEIAKIQALNEKSTQQTQTIPQRFAFNAVFEAETSQESLEWLGGTLNGAFDLEEMKLFFEFAMDQETLQIPELASFKPMQFFMRPNPQNAEELQLLGHYTDEPWAVAPFALPVNSEQLELFRSLSSSDGIDKEEFANIFEKMGLDSMAELVRNPEDTSLLMNLLALFEFEEVTVDGRDIIRIGYAGSVGAIYKAMNLDMNVLMSQTTGLDNLTDNPLYAELSPEELAEYQAFMEQQMQQSVDQAMKMNIAFAIDFDVATSLPMQYHYSFAIPMGLGTADPVIADMFLVFEYSDNASQLIGLDYIISASDGRENMDIVVAVEIDYDADIDWNTLDEAVAADIS